MKLFCITSVFLIFVVMHLILLYRKIKFVNNNFSELVNISFTTTPGRINKIKNTVDSYLNQDYKNIKLYITIPNKSFKGLEYKIPVWLQKYADEDKINIINIDKDEGPITKILGILKLITNPEEIILVADDDLIYPKNWVSLMMHYHRKYPNKCISLTTESFKKYKISPAYTGTLIKRKFITDEIFNIPHESCARGDDLWISHNLYKNKIEIYNIFPRITNFILKRTWIYETDYDIQNPEAKGTASSNLENYNNCYKYLK